MRRVRIALCETIAVFNTGAASKAVMDSCGVTPGSNMMRPLRQQDKSRIRSAAQKSVLSTKSRGRVCDLSGNPRGMRKPINQGFLANPGVIHSRSRDAG